MTGEVQASGLALSGRLYATSLILRAGELACLIGPNGSGKTSLLHALAGVGRPSGTVEIDGVDPHRAGPARRMELLSYLPASREVHWPVAARDLIALGCPTPEVAGHIPQILAKLRLTEFSTRRIDRMSTGERSRVLIARALVSKTRLVLLDEPAANLDPLWQLRLMELLKVQARENGQCMLVAVHDLGLARQFADRVIVMDQGKITADGDPDQIFAGQVIPQVFGIEEREGRWVTAG